jgi:hypothetical protein
MEDIGLPGAAGVQVQEAKRLRRRFHFGVEIGDHILERGNRLLNCSDLHQLPPADRAIAVLQSDYEIPPLLLELYKRQTVVRQVSQHDPSTPQLRDTSLYPDWSAFRLQNSGKF